MNKIKNTTFQAQQAIGIKQHKKGQNIQITNLERKLAVNRVYIRVDLEFKELSNLPFNLIHFLPLGFSLICRSEVSIKGLRP